MSKVKVRKSFPTLVSSKLMKFKKLANFPCISYPSFTFTYFPGHNKVQTWKGGLNVCLVNYPSARCTGWNIYQNETEFKLWSCKQENPFLWQKKDHLHLINRRWPDSVLFNPRNLWISCFTSTLKLKIFCRWSVKWFADMKQKTDGLIQGFRSASSKRHFREKQTQYKRNKNVHSVSRKSQPSESLE